MPTSTKRHALGTSTRGRTERAMEERRKPVFHLYGSHSNR